MAEMNSARTPPKKGAAPTDERPSNASHINSGTRVGEPDEPSDEVELAVTNEVTMPDCDETRQGRETEVMLSVAGSW